MHPRGTLKWPCLPEEVKRRRGPTRWRAFRNEVTKKRRSLYKAERLLSKYFAYGLC
jgi:hypothetical protein